MPFYIRKSVSAGPFRFNLSKSGVGLSVGVKGLRIGTGPRGHYVHAGRGGLYYRASLGGSRSARDSVIAHQAPSSLGTAYAEQGRVTMIEVQSGEVAAMRDDTVADLLYDLNKKQAQVPFAPIAAGCFAFIGILALFVDSSGWQPATNYVAIAALIGVLPAWAIGKWFDSYKRTSVLFYNLEGGAEDAYKKVTESFDKLAACHGKWHLASGGVVRDITTWKRNAGADHLVNRKAARLAYALPQILRSNVTPPAITLGDRTFYFLPEVTIVKHRRQFGSVGYDDLNIRSQASRFIEDARPPSDAQVVDHTWQHPNKTGGPDRRFRDNRELPVCLYEVMHLSSSSGVNELLQFSRTGVVEPFSAALHDLPRGQAQGGVEGLTRLGNSVTSERVDVAVPDFPAQRSLDWKLMAGAGVAIAGAAVVAAYALHGGSRTSTEIHGSVAEPSTASTAGIAQNRMRLRGVEPQLPSNTLIGAAALNVLTATVKTAANVRSGPNISADIVRVAGSGEKFGVFARVNGWVQVGTDKPIGWIAASLLIE